MDAQTIEHLQYPIGKFQPPAFIDSAQRAEWIKSIETLTEELSNVVRGLTDHQLDTPYREHGWTVRQVVHHVADSHLNSQIRFRWALTEDVPLIKVYDEKLWAELPDSKTLSVDVSLQLLAGLHQRWTALLTAMTQADFERRLRHPVSGEMDLNRMLALYAWHGKHHVAHIATLKVRMGW